MKTATITAAKAQFRALIDQVRHGETILIVDRGQPVARLESVLTEGIDDSEGRLVRLERAGLIRRGITPPPLILTEEPPETEDQASILRALLAEREESRRSFGIARLLFRCW